MAYAKGIEMSTNNKAKSNNGTIGIDALRREKINTNKRIIDKNARQEQIYYNKQLSKLQKETNVAKALSNIETLHDEVGQIKRINYPFNTSKSTDIATGAYGYGMEDQTLPPDWPFDAESHAIRAKDIFNGMLYNIAGASPYLAKNAWQDIANGFKRLGQGLRGYGTNGYALTGAGVDGMSSGNKYNDGGNARNDVGNNQKGQLINDWNLMVENGGQGDIIYKQGITDKDRENRGQGGGAQGITGGAGKLVPYGTEQAPQTFISAVTPEQKEQLQADDKMWEDFKAQFADEQHMRDYILSLSEKELQKIPEGMRYRAQMVIDEEYQNMRDYLSYQGYGDIPWLAAMADGYFDVMTLGLGNDLLKNVDPNRAEQYELARKAYPFAALAGEIAGWITPGSVSGAAASKVGKALSPYFKPISGYIGKGVQSLLGKASPKVVSAAQGFLTKGFEGGVTGFGVGTADGGVHSFLDGNAPAEVIQDAFNSGVQSAGPSALGNGILGGIQG